MTEWLILGSVFVFIVGATMLFVRWYTGESRRLDKRLEGGSSEDGPFTKEDMLLGDLTEPLGVLTAPGAEKKTALEQELREAGYYRPTAILEYSALRAMLISFPLFVALILAMIVDVDLIPYILGGGAILAMLGYSLPRIFVNYFGRKRSRQIERGLPVAIDLLSLCLTGGQNLLTALARVARDLEFSFPILSQELRIVHKHAEMVGLEMSLQQFAARSNVQEVKNLAVILTHSERLGTDIATALFEFSSNFRSNLRQRAEEQANRVSFFLLFPTILCLLVPAIFLFNAPLYYEFSRIRKDMGEGNTKNMQSLKDVKAATRKANAAAGTNAPSTGQQP